MNPIPNGAHPVRPSLTARQAAILGVIATSIRERGYPPTRREIADAMGIKSTNGVNDHLVALERKGYVRLHSTIARGLVLLVGRDDAPERALLAEAARVAPIGAVRAALDALPSAEVAHAA